jgi:hypothetical protein
MMEVAKGSGIELLNSYDTEVDQGEVRDRDAPVYFDRKHLVFFSFEAGWLSSLFIVSVFKSIVFVFPIIHLLTFNIVVLILGPIVLVSLFIWKRIISARLHEHEGLQRSRAPHFRSFSLNPPSPSFRRRNHNGAPPIPQGRIDRLMAIWVHGKFWAALVVTLGLEALLIFLYIVINPFVSSEIPLVMPSLN